jgi:2-haloacid dehalogenase
MLGGPIQETVDVLAELRKAGVRLFGLSNWSGETFEVARRLPEYAFLGWFEAVVISGEVGIAKPDPRIFRHLLDRYGLEPSRTLFIDDVPANIDVANDLGMRAMRFVDAESLRAELASRGLLNGRVA